MKDTEQLRREEQDQLARIAAGSKHTPACREGAGACVCNIGKGAASRTLPLPFPEPMPPVPDKVLVVPFWRVFAEMVCEGDKTIETRERPFEKSAQWLGVYAAEKVGRLTPAAAAQPAAKRWVDAKGKALPDARLGPAGHVLGLVWVTGSRLLEPTDLPRSLFWEAGRFAWLLSHHVRFKTPVPFVDLAAEAGLAVRAPRSAVWVQGRQLRAAMGPG